MATDDSTARGRELGAELRRRRKQIGLNGAEMAHKLGWSPSKVSRLETGARRGASEVDIAVYLANCRVPRAELDTLLDLYNQDDDGYWLQPHREQLPGELRSLVIQESTASAIGNYEPLVVPGLLQTEDYARALFYEVNLLPPEEIELCVRARMDRQDILRRPWPPKFRFFIHEQALLLPVGSSAVMHEQMLHLLFLGSRPQCDLRVVPVSGGAQTGAGGPFVLLEYAEHKPVACLEHQAASLFLEDRKAVAMYRIVLQKLVDIALDEGQSREFLAGMASEYDRTEEDDDARGRSGRSELAKEQL